MGNITPMCFSIFLIVLLLNSTKGAEEPVYSLEGGELTLESAVPAQLKPLTSIVWKHERDMVVEWIEKLGSVEYYGVFRGHTNLDTKTGRVEIHTRNSSYSGVYSVEFNGELQSKKYKVDVIKKVPKPTVVRKPLTCPNEDTCTLSCDGDTAGAEPVTYSWRTDQMDLNGESEQSMKISKDDSDVKLFFCQIKNPLSQEDSDGEKNPFHQDSPVGPIVGGVLAAVAVVAGAVFGFLKRDAIQQMICNKNGSDPDACSAAPKEPQGSPSEAVPLKQNGDKDVKADEPTG